MFLRNHYLKILAIFSLILLTSCPSSNTDKPLVPKPHSSVIFEERLLASLPDNGLTHSARFSPNGTSVAYELEKPNGKSALVLDGIEGKAHRGIGNVSFNNDGSRLSFIAQDAIVRQTLVMNGEESKSYVCVYGLRYSPDGKHYGYKAQKALGRHRWCWITVIDGIIGKAYDYYSSDIVFSAEGGHYGFWTESARNGQHILVIDGIPHPLPHDVSYNTLIFSSNGNRYAYVANIWKEHDFKQCIVVDSIRGDIYDYVDNLTFSPDGRHLAYVGVENGKHLSIPSFIFGPDGTRITGRGDWEGGKWFIVVDGVRGDGFDEIRGVSYSHDGQRLSFLARLNDRWYMVVDGNRGKPIKANKVYGIIFSPDARRNAFVTQIDDSYHVVIDGVLDDKHYINHISSLIFSPDGNHLAYVAVNNTNDEKAVQYYAVVDGTTVGQYDEIYSPYVKGRCLFFSPDSHSLAFGARNGRDLWWRVIQLP